MENDHKFTKSKSRYRQWYQSFTTARNTLDEMEAMRMIQKGQNRNIGKDVAKQIVSSAIYLEWLLSFLKVQ